MLKIPRVALFQAPESEQIAISALFQKYDYSIRLVQNVDTIRHLTVDEGAKFDVIIVPRRLAGNLNLMPVCMQIRSDDMLASTPIIALSDTSDANALQALYTAGVDVVFTPPINVDALYFQIGALARLNRVFKEKLNQGFQHTGLYHPVINAFHSMRDALLLFDTNSQCIFINGSGSMMLSVNEEMQQADIQDLVRQFIPYMKEHDSMAKVQPPNPRGLPYSSSFEADVRRKNGQVFRSLITFTSILREQSEVAGYSMAMKDLSEIDHLANTLIQSQRTRALCLLSTSCSIRLLEALHKRALISPMKHVEDFLLSEDLKTPLNASLTSLLEAIDLVINPILNIRVKVEHDLWLGVRPSDFSQIVGHMLLHAVEYAGAKGEAALHCSEGQAGRGVFITITAESRNVTPFSADDLMSSLIHGDFVSLKSFEDIADQLQLGIGTAQKIAEGYRTTIEYQQPSNALLKMRVRLPVIAVPEGQ